jgi:DNA-binding GntR family transcriptional regulator
MLEVIAAEAAAARMTAQDFAELERRLAALAEPIAANNYYEAAQADLDFHRYVWHCSGNEMLCRVLELLVVPLFAFISILRSQGLQRLTDVVEAHSPLVEALRTRDPETIRTAFQRGAIKSYAPFLGDAGGDPDVAQMFGFLEPVEQVRSL